MYKIGKEVHLKRRRRLEELEYHFRRFNISTVGERDTEGMKLPKKTVQKNFRELKDEIPDGLSTRSGIIMALDFNKNKWKLDESTAELSKF